MLRGTVAEINLSAVAKNLRVILRIVGNRPVIAVVKADAYGHGAVAVSKRLVSEKVSYLAVAYTAEAIQLRQSGITVPIIVLFEREDIASLFDFQLIPVISDMHTASALSREARRRFQKINVHVKIDTGMGRMGLHGKHVMQNLLKIQDMPGLDVTGLLSHFSEADLADRSYAGYQLERFRKIREELSARGKGKILSHLANSAAVLAFKESYFDAVRPGLMLYGYSPLRHGKNHLSSPVAKGRQERIVHDITLTPAMSVKTKLLFIRSLPAGTPISYGRTFITRRPSRIGVIPAGYADGYNRLFSNKAEVLIRGKRVPVVGRVCMDLTMIDLTDIREAKENDEVVLLGKQGREKITADELAARADTISYEILTSLGSRSRRVYV